MKNRTKLIGLLAVTALSSPVRAEGISGADVAAAETALLLIMAVALLLIVVIGYVLRLTGKIREVSKIDATGKDSPGPEKFQLYLEALDGGQIEALTRLIHTQSQFHTLLTNDHAKEQLV
jgi:hypothetical protein